MLLPERLKYFRQDKGLNEEQFGEIFDLSSSAIHLYECGKMPVSMELLEQFAKFFNISPALLLGTQFPDLPIEEAIESYRLIQDLVGIRQSENQAQRAGGVPTGKKEPSFNLSSQKMTRKVPVKTNTTANDKMAPVFIRINAAESLYGDKYIEFYWPLSDSITRVHGDDLRNYYYLRIQGNSMEPTISDQDIVLIKKQMMVDDNDMAVVLSATEDAWVTRINYMDGKLFMHPDNKAYAAQTLNTHDCKIIGKVLWKTSAPRRA